jgi:DNA-binding FadR family transcriptional regulator
VITGRITSHSLPKLVTERLIDLIAGGQLPPGSTLPPERELCETLGVSRIALREATQVLKALGVLDSSPGRGTVVVKSAPYAAFEQLSLLLGLSTDAMLHVLEARRILEAAAIRLAAERATEAHLTELRAILKRQADALDDRKRFSEEDMAFHRTIISAAQNPILLQMLDGVARPLWSVRLRTAEIPGRLQKALGYHTRLVRALSKHDADAAERILLQHLDDIAADVAKLREQPSTSDQ